MLLGHVYWEGATESEPCRRRLARRFCQEGTVKHGWTEALHRAWFLRMHRSMAQVTMHAAELAGLGLRAGAVANDSQDFLRPSSIANPCVPLVKMRVGPPRFAPGVPEKGSSQTRGRPSVSGAQIVDRIPRGRRCRVGELHADRSCRSTDGMMRGRRSIGSLGRSVPPAASESGVSLRPIGHRP